MDEPPVAEIAAQLNHGIEALARSLCGEPNAALSTATQFRYGRKGSLAIEIAGDRKGRWYDHEADVGGDGLELIRHRLGHANGQAVDWARGWLGQPRQPGTSGRSAALPAAAPNGRAAAVAEILRKSGPIGATAGALYLRNRGITADPPDSLRFRTNAFDRYGALVALATDAGGDVLAVQQIYVTEDGRKAPVAVDKRTNKAVDGWSERASVRLPGRAPLVLAEGVVTALSIWQATGQETWACLGIANIGRAPVPAGAAVIIARDGDAVDSPADRQIHRAVAALRHRGHAVTIAVPPRGKDFNDTLVEHGEAAVRSLIAGASPLAADAPSEISLQIGSDVEIAGRVRDLLAERHGGTVHAEGAFWRYDGTHWVAIPDHELRVAVHGYDGAGYRTPAGEPARIKLGKGRIDSILYEYAALVAQPDFFEAVPIGINCAAGFIRFAEDGTPGIEPHHRDHRCRHTLPGRWRSGGNGLPPAGSLLGRLLGGVFRGDDDMADKMALLAEVCGAAALGYATRLMQPRAAILKGETAENGKSQILDLARGLLPPSAICSVTAARMGDERHIVGLAGKLLNASDELSSSAAIASETFKAVITGEPVEGRDVYRSRVEFRPVAQHLFATNTLPPFQGGMDRGVQRRLLVLTFNRVIPLEERVEHIGRRIASEEADLLLAWAVGGASRLIRRRTYTTPPSSKQALADWMHGADPVLAWLDECVEVRPIIDGHPALATRVAYERFHDWAVAEGFKNEKLPAINGFVQRVQANAVGVEHRRTGNGRLFLGLVVTRMAATSQTW
jgi:P4 family phage/plasmid primase-like protien